MDQGTRSRGLTDLSSGVFAFSTLGWGVSSAHRPQTGVSGDCLPLHSGVRETGALFGLRALCACACEHACMCVRGSLRPHVFIWSVLARVHTCACVYIHVYVLFCVHTHASVCVCVESRAKTPPLLQLVWTTWSFAGPSGHCGFEDPAPGVGRGWGCEDSLKGWDNGATQFESCPFLSGRLWLEQGRP